MKAKLIKTIDGYHLRSLIKDIPRSINVYHKISETEGEFGFGEHSGKLSKQNCDEIFGIIDVEKLADSIFEKESSNMLHPQHQMRNTFILGFNKAMELNKDKVFTLEDVKKVIEMSRDIKYVTFSIDELIQSLQQPTEIEVEIEMEDVIQLKKRVGGITNMGKPKLDLQGCLILKKI